MKKIEYIILIILFLYELIFPFNYYTKKENTEYLKHQWQKNYSVEIPNQLYQKSYLMPNGKYVDVTDSSYTSGIIPVSIRTIAKKFDNPNMLMAQWAINSNWGQYSFGNNPFGIEYNDVKQLINIPSTATVLTKKYKWVTTKDSSFYKLSFVKLASFESIEESFKTYNTLINTGKIIPTELENQTSQKIKDLIISDKKFKEKMDTMKVNFFKSDTISIGDSIYIISMKGDVLYTKHYLPNFLLIGFIFYILIKYRNLFI
jgi:hypothetical protein